MCIYDLVVKNGKVFMGEELISADIAIKNGKIEAIQKSGLEINAHDIIDAKGKLVLPGSIDPHVHVRGPGKEEREDFFTGTAAAAAGGVTTIIEHPIANPPQYCLEILNKRIAAANEMSVVDFAFYGAAGAEFPDKMQELADSGLIVSFKTFLHEAPKGRELEFMGLTMKNDAEQYEGMKTVARTGKICGVHAENNDIIKKMIEEMKKSNQSDGMAHGNSRPPISEYETVSKLLMFAENTGARLEFCHISTPEAMEMIKTAKLRGLDVYLETCPHYLFYNDEALREFGPFAKCNPPLRTRESMEKLWDYINDGSVDFIGSDHAPYTYEEKKKGEENIFDCPAGIPCIEMRIPLLLNAVNENKLSLKRMVELTCTNPAKIFGLYPQKGVIQVGSDGDVIIVDMEEDYRVHTADMHTKSRDSALMFENLPIKGRVKKTIVRGKVIMEDNKVNETEKGWGQLVKGSKK